MTGRTLFDKVWEEHVVADLGGGFALLHVDRHLLHDLGGPRGLADVAEQGHGVSNPGLPSPRPTTPSRARRAAPTRARSAQGCCASCVPRRPRPASASSISASP